MKKGRAVLCIGLLALLLAGCGGKDPENTADRPKDTQTQGDENLGQEPKAPDPDGNEPASETDEKEMPGQASSSGAVTARESTDSPDRESQESSEASGEAFAPEETLEAKVEEILQGLTLEEKVAQMFVVLPEALTGVSRVTEAGEDTKIAFDRLPVGGIIYMKENLTSGEQTEAMLSSIQAYSMERLGLPAFLAVDEEGGTVARVGGREAFGIPALENMAQVGASGDLKRAREVGATIGAYLSRLGFNLDFAPDADVWSNPENEVVRHRSFGSEPELVADMSMEVLYGLNENGIYGSLKHFPGHGATEGDTHAGYAYTDKTLEDLKECELIPFQRGIEEDVEFIMVGHISLPNVTGDDMPASLSRELVTELLRKKMGHEGIVITDALNMGAISKNYSSQEAAVLAVEAGVDLLLMPKDLEEAYQGLLSAVEEGSISQDRIDESLRRILKVKISLMEQ